LVQGGWAVAVLGDDEAGLAQIDRGLAIHEGTGAILNRSYYLALRAEVCARLGRTRDGLQSLDTAQALLESTGEHWYQPEVLRLRGELLAPRAPKRTGRTKRESTRKTRGKPSASRDPAQAEALLLEALESARRMRAVALELRAARSLARLWHASGRSDEARDLLGRALRAFAKGDGGADVRDSRDTLESWA
jgi:predicted ATPase